MCIRDSSVPVPMPTVVETPVPAEIQQAAPVASPSNAKPKRCLLYTSDAADERSSVDLGGRRIIKKKKSQAICDQPEN